jgi:hypothetical protein
MSNRSKAVHREEHELVVPDVCVQGPTMRENDWRAFAPFLVENLSAIRSRDE